MSPVDRRAFLKKTGVLAGAAAVAWSGRLSAAQGKRKFTMDLVCGAIGVRADQREAIRLAQWGGFESVQPSPQFLAGLSKTELDDVLGKLRDARLQWGAAGLPVDFRKDDTTFQGGIKRLPELAQAVQQAGGSRMSTWLSPSQGKLTYVSNFKQHTTRLRQVAKILGDHGLRFGLEYVGPKTSWTAKMHPFVHTMVETKELIAAIGQDNVGFVLDSWHWYTAHETEKDLLTLSNNDIVACDLNDAPAGIEIDEQIDNRRELPAATGVINLKAFLGALVKIGYDGPVRSEPFNQKLREMDNEAAIKATAAAMRKAFALVE